MMKASQVNGFFGILISRPTGVLVILTTLIVLGVMSYMRLPLQMLPGGIEGSRFTVMVANPGSSAAENVEKVARPIEEQLSTLPNLDDVWTVCRPGSVRISIRFNRAGDLQLAKAELRDRIERARPQLPTDVGNIWVWSNDDGDMPIIWMAVTASEDADQEDVDRLIEERIKRPLEAVDGVSQVQLWGTLEDSIRILLDEQKVVAARMDLGNLIQRLSTDNFAKPLGEVASGERELLLRSDMRFQNLEEIAAYPIGNGLRLGDVADVRRVKAVGDRLTRIDGRYASYGMIQKEGAANVVETSARIQKVLAEIQADTDLGGQLGVTVFFDQADFIRASLGQLKTTALWGGSLALLVLFGFLRRVRTTLVVALSIPISILLALTFEYFTGGTFNVLTMTGLTLALGMLVDNSVVVIENIARLRKKGHSPISASVEGVRDVGLAVALATVTSVVVFLPLIFMIGDPMMSVFLRALGIPLCSALVASLIVALVFMPVLAARVQGPRPPLVTALAERMAWLSVWPTRAFAHAIGAARLMAWGFLWFLHRVNRGLLRLGTPLRPALLLGLVGLFAWSFLGANTTTDWQALGNTFGVKAPRLSASLESRAFNLLLGVLVIILALPRWRTRPKHSPPRPSPAAPPGVSVLSWIQETNRRLVGWTLDHRPHACLLGLCAVMTVAIPMSNMSITSMGSEEDMTALEFDVELEKNFTLAQASAEMARYEDLLDPLRDELGFEHVIVRFWAGGGEVGLRWLDRLDQDFMTETRERLRRELPKFPGHRMRFGKEEQLGRASKQTVRFQLIGPNADLLASLGEEAIQILSNVEGLTDIRSPLEDAPEEVRLEFDREAAFQLGITSDRATSSVSWALRGAMLPRFQEKGREVPIIIEYDEEQMAGLDALKDLSIWTDTGPVALSSFATTRFQPGPRSIWRWNGMTSFTLQARIDAPDRLQERVESGYAALEAGLDLPRGYELGRENSSFASALKQIREMQLALLFAAALVYIVMAILFESLALPLAVMATVPFAFLGAMWTLFLTGTAMDAVGWIGVIILVGVVVNNGIVLIDKIHRCMTIDGLPRRAAIIAGTGARVRPILMTALTTVFGLLPMALSQATSEGIDYRALATCVAGGLAISTIFTLWMVPLAYSLAEDSWAAARKTATRALSSKTSEPKKEAPALT
jgi:HAE1 family hydrophobic/amphiphilic exporter-1